MEAIGYGLIFGTIFLVALIAGAVLMLHVKNMPEWKPFDFLNNKDEEEKIMRADKVKPANYDEPPKSAEEYALKYKRDGFHEELPSAERD